MKKLIGWRIAQGIFDRASNTLKGVYSAFSKEIISIKENSATLQHAGGFFVGTKRRFCLAYYRGMTEPTETRNEYRKEILLRLEIDPADLQDSSDVSKWGSEAAYMGNEAVVKRARITRWFNVKN